MRDYLNYDKIEKLYCKNDILFGEFNHDAIITYVIPTYKRYDMLKRCVESITTQTKEVPYSVLISDNNPQTYNDYKDNPQKYDFFKDKYVIYSVNRENIGGCANCNQAVFLAKTKYICMVHDDDIVHPMHLYYVNQNLKKDFSLKYLSFGLKKIDLRYENDLSFKQSKIKRCNIKQINMKDLYYNYDSPMLGSIIMREAYLNVGGIEVGKSNMEDYVFTYKIIKKYEGYLLNYHLYGYTILENDSLNNDIWNDILIEKFFLRKFIKKSKYFISLPNFLLLARDIAFLESNKSIKKMCLNKKYIASSTKVFYLILLFNIFLCKIILKIK